MNLSSKLIHVGPVNSQDADVIFQSCDGILFGIHRPNLQTNTEGFPPPEIATGDEVVPLSESAATLELLFQFIYPRRHPGLDEIVFADLAALAEAAEKYQVFSAMNICRIRMRLVVLHLQWHSNRSWSLESFSTAIHLDFFPGIFSLITPQRS
jgi:hypothetical protein